MLNNLRCDLCGLPLLPVSAMGVSCKCERAIITMPDGSIKTAPRGCLAVFEENGNESKSNNRI